MNTECCFSSLIDSMDDLLFICDLESRITLVNGKTLEFLGKQPPEVIGRGIADFVPGSFRKSMSDELSSWTKKEKPSEYEVPVLNREGRAVIFKFKVAPVICENRVTGFIFLAKDITYRRLIEDELKRSQSRFLAAVENMLDCFCIYRAVRDTSGHIVDFVVEYANAAACESHGMTPEQQSGKSFAGMARVHSSLIGEYRRVLDTGRPLSTEKLFYEDPNGQNIVKAYDVRAVKLDDGVAVIWRDITARKKAESELRALTLTDELTGLYNRRGFITLAQQQLKIARRMGREMLLLFADVDQLKLINDTLGHQEGDRALIDTAHILKQTFREPDIIARIGGDEFAVLIIEASKADSGIVANRLKESIQAFNQRRVRPYQLSLSAGIAHFDSESPCFVNELLEQADRLMYENKRLKRMSRE